MALITSTDALAALQAAGRSAFKSPARGRCRTLCYCVDGQFVNLGRLRQLAQELTIPQPLTPAATSAAVVAEPEAPIAPEPVAAPSLADLFATQSVAIKAEGDAAHSSALSTIAAIRSTIEAVLVDPEPEAPGAQARPRSLAPLSAELGQSLGLGRGGMIRPTPESAAWALEAAGHPVTPETIDRAVESCPPLPTHRPVTLHGEEGRPPAPVTQGPCPELPTLATPAPTGDAWAGQPWDPGTPEARARVALQGERVATLWPIAQALRGEGLTLPGSWASDGPVMAGEWSYNRALAALPLGAIAAAAAALAALPPVTQAQARALTLCRGGAV